MNKILFSTIITLIISTICNAQTLEKGSLSFLNGETKLNVVIDYSKGNIKGMTEEEFIKASCATAREGDGWRDVWNNKAKSELKAKFIFTMNSGMVGSGLYGGNYDDAKYTLTIVIFSIDARGTTIADAIITETGKSGVLAKTRINGKGGRIGTFVNLTGDGFKRAGTHMASIIRKAM
jgi:hypothetical protein